MTTEHHRGDAGDWLRMRSNMSNCMTGYIRRMRSSKMTSRMEELEREVWLKGRDCSMVACIAHCW